MFTKKDFQKYFEQMREVENKMINLTTILQKEFKDQEILALINEIHADELRHMGLVDEMAALCVKEAK